MENDGVVVQSDIFMFLSVFVCMSMFFMFLPLLLSLSLSFFLWVCVHACVCGRTHVRKRMVSGQSAINITYPDRMRLDSSSLHRNAKMEDFFVAFSASRGRNSSHSLI